jgi:hypothetical protein
MRSISENGQIPTSSMLPATLRSSCSVDHVREVCDAGEDRYQGGSVLEDQLINVHPGVARACSEPIPERRCTMQAKTDVKAGPFTRTN